MSDQFDQAVAAAVQECGDTVWTTLSPPERCSRIYRELRRIDIENLPLTLAPIDRRNLPHGDHRAGLEEITAATKAGLADIHTEMRDMRGEIRDELREMRSETVSGFDTLRSETRAPRTETAAEMREPRAGRRADFR